MPETVLAVLTAPDAGREAPEPFRFVDPDTAVLQVRDLGATRGDGVFETMGVGSGRAQAVDAHLARLARSAAMLELPEPDEAAWRAATIAVAERLAHHAEGFVKLVYTRGVEGTGRPTGWVLGSPSPDHTAARTAGIDVVVLDRGLPHDSAGELPWLLQGAKTLSYAVNMAAIREAKRRGADDALFVSSDGFLLEGPTSSLLLQRGDRLLTPSTSLGILAGTTQAEAFRFGRAQGLTTSYEVLTPDALADADALWLLSSVRNAAPIKAIDGVARSIDAEFTSRLNAHLLARRD
ncbi:aminodeoxychorismate lyase [Amnibacterium kyonggiense]|uniref:4-amino-4-deoxychorismate lyase n=1 Tax=Amnibacterium kyonggiense TaxID=595671 RepID=A0A4R7FER7_9MICO|nr:aminodeoxychorismate lyase [Amnibacterium kyonggiense]TDS74493.1 4-amino-4-deoxychorismate lyase [Amnibacterium kyonggiense]